MNVFASRLFLMCSRAQQLTSKPGPDVKPPNETILAGSRDRYESDRYRDGPRRDNDRYDGGRDRYDGGRDRFRERYDDRDRRDYDRGV